MYQYALLALQNGRGYESILVKWQGRDFLIGKEFVFLFFVPPPPILPKAAQWTTQ
jgi:hypothetical protein